MSHLKDPTTQYYTGEYPKQKQPTPGIQANMNRYRIAARKPMLVAVA